MSRRWTCRWCLVLFSTTVSGDATRRLFGQYAFDVLEPGPRQRAILDDGHTLRNSNAFLFRRSPSPSSLFEFVFRDDGPLLSRLDRLD